ncbi:MAG: sensor histidine kinase [Solirubrobacterales bacterium]
MRRLLPSGGIRNRLALLFFGITAGAVGVVYLYVVPQLTESLTVEKIDQLNEIARQDAPTLRSAFVDLPPAADVRRLVRQVGQRSDARVTLLAARPGSRQPTFVLGDSDAESSAVAPRYAAAEEALSTGGRADAVEEISGQRFAQVAVPVGQAPTGDWVAVFSSSLADVGANVGLIQRQILIAGLIALAGATLVGWFVARAVARRVRRLEHAVGEVAEGRFGQEIVVDSSDELGELARAFNEMQGRLERLDDARREFIATASHELRTPLFSLGGFVELLESEDLDEPTRREFVATMREQIERLTKLAAELLDLSKLDAGAMELAREPVELAGTCRRTAVEFAAAAAARGSELGFVAPAGTVIADADERRVSQILRVLLDNAISHNPPGTTVTLEVATDGRRSQVVVRDDGPGIPDATRHRIFDRFFTGDGTGGSGLGLAIARELAERMHGELDVASRRGATVFALDLPAVRSPDAARAVLSPSQA